MILSFRAFLKTIAINTVIFLSFKLQKNLYCINRYKNKCDDLHRNRARSIACTEGAPRVLTFTSTRLFVMLVRSVLSRRERAAIPSSVGA